MTQCVHAHAQHGHADVWNWDKKKHEDTRAPMRHSQAIQSQEFQHLNWTWALLERLEMWYRIWYIQHTRRYTERKGTGFTHHCTAAWPPEHCRKATNNPAKATWPPHDQNEHNTLIHGCSATLPTAHFINFLCEQCYPLTTSPLLPFLRSGHAVCTITLA